MNLTSNYTNTFQSCLSTLAKVVASGEARPTNPLLIRPPEGYAQSKLKAMYFGQETNGWEGGYEENKGVEHLLGIYDEFANKGRGFRYGGQFWNALKSFQQAFLKVEPTSAFLWNNIIKVGKYSEKNRPSEDIILWQDPWFAVTREEMKTFVPNVVIFLTGPNYDDMIRRTFGEFQISSVNGFNTRKLARINSGLLPHNTFRTYHPGYLYRVGFDKVRDEIIKGLQR
jgi:hypothetical protein